MKLDIGCGLTLPDGYVGVDIDCALSDLYGARRFMCCAVGSEELCVPSDSVEEIRAHHVLEHLVSPNALVWAMREFYRVLEPGGHLVIEVPYAGTKVAVQDHTHVLQFNEDSWKYFDMTSSVHGYCTTYQYGVDFQAEDIHVHGVDPNHLMLCAKLRAVKPGRGYNACSPGTTAAAKDSLEREEQSIMQSRTVDYGDFTDSARNLGLQWTGILQNYYGIELREPIPSHIVALMLADLKVSRASYPNGVIHDSYLDAGVYIKLAEICATGRTVKETLHEDT